MDDKTGVVLAKAIQQKGENELDVKGVLKKGDRAEIHDLTSEKGKDLNGSVVLVGDGRTRTLPLIQWR